MKRNIICSIGRLFCLLLALGLLFCLSSCGTQKLDEALVLATYLQRFEKPEDFSLLAFEYWRLDQYDVFYVRRGASGIWEDKDVELLITYDTGTRVYLNYFLSDRFYVYDSDLATLWNNRDTRESVSYVYSEEEMAEIKQAAVGYCAEIAAVIAASNRQ